MSKFISIEEALSLNKIGIFQYRLVTMAGFLFMTDALEVTLLTFLSSCAGAEWNLNYAQKATITGIVFIGIVLGSLFWGQVADWYGRRFAFLASMGVIAGGGLLSGTSPNYEALILFRAIAGFGIGGMTVPFDLVSEFLPGPSRGFFLVFLEFFWCFGSMFVAGVAWASLESLGWRMLIYITIVPVVIVLICSIIFVPESPRWLWIKGRSDEAMEVIRNAALDNGVQIPPHIKLIPYSGGEVEEEASYWDLVSTAAARRITFPLWVIWAMFGFTYYGTILFTTRLFSNHQDKSRADESSDSNQCEFNYPAIFLSASSEIIAVMLAVVVIDNVGRVKSQSGFYLLGAVTVVLMSFHDMPFAAVVVLAALTRICAMASTLSTWVATPELLSTHVRTVGHGSCAAVSKLCSFLSPYLVISSASALEVGLILGFLQLVAAMAAHCLPETAGMVMEEDKPAVGLADSSSSAVERSTDTGTGTGRCYHSSSSSSSSSSGMSSDRVPMLGMTDGSVELTTVNRLHWFSAASPHQQQISTSGAGAAFTAVPLDE